MLPKLPKGICFKHILISIHFEILHCLMNIQKDYIVRYRFKYLRLLVSVYRFSGIGTISILVGSVLVSIFNFWYRQQP